MALPYIDLNPPEHNRAHLYTYLLPMLVSMLQWQSWAVVTDSCVACKAYNIYYLTLYRKKKLSNLALVQFQVIIVLMHTSEQHRLSVRQTWVQKRAWQLYAAMWPWTSSSLSFNYLIWKNKDNNNIYFIGQCEDVRVKWGRPCEEFSTMSGK